MKKISTMLALSICLLFGSTAPTRAQSTIVAEGYSAAAIITEAMARSTLESMRQEDPSATLAEARLSVAQRGARMEAMRNAAEFIHGIDFEYSGGVLRRKMTARTTGGIQPGRCTYRTLASGLVVASLEVVMPAGVGEGREGLLRYEVTGVCDDEEVDSVVLAMRQARLDAVSRAVEQAIEERYRGRADPNRTFTGTVYLLRTVEDAPGIPYRVTMEVQVRLDRLIIE